MRSDASDINPLTTLGVQWITAGTIAIGAGAFYALMMLWLSDSAGGGVITPPILGTILAVSLFGVAAVINGLALLRRGWIARPLTIILSLNSDCYCGRPSHSVAIGEPHLVVTWKLCITRWLLLDLFTSYDIFQGDQISTHRPAPSGAPQRFYCYGRQTMEFLLGRLAECNLALAQFRRIYCRQGSDQWTAGRCLAA
jgi:hypothetical protein